jgi:hypothetical protein
LNARPGRSVPLLAGGWVFVDEHTFGFQVQKFFITRVAQEPCFSPITDESSLSRFAQMEIFQQTGRKECSQRLSGYQ